jgi:hypothetical protein
MPCPNEMYYELNLISQILNVAITHIIREVVKSWLNPDYPGALNRDLILKALAKRRGE